MMRIIIPCLQLYNVALFTRGSCLFFLYLHKNHPKLAFSEPRTNHEQIVALSSSNSPPSSSVHSLIDRVDSLSEHTQDVLKHQSLLFHWYCSCQCVIVVVVQV